MSSLRVPAKPSQILGNPHLLPGIVQPSCCICAKHCFLYAISRNLGKTKTSPFGEVSVRGLVKQGRPLSALLLRSPPPKKKSPQRVPACPTG